MRHLALALLVWSLALTAGATAATADSLRVTRVEGVLKDVTLGNDSCTVTVRADNGRRIQCYQGSGSLEGYSSDQKEEFERYRESLGTTWPTTADLGSRVLLCYVTQDRLFIGYQVISRPSQLWVVILASEKSAEAAWAQRERAHGTGFAQADVLESSDFPRLRPGYHVVTASTFTSQSAAQACLRQAIARGWRDAYVKRAR